jgi:hypothetical protein
MEARKAEPGYRVPAKLTKVRLAKFFSEMPLSEKSSLTVGILNLPNHDSTQSPKSD